MNTRVKLQVLWRLQSPLAYINDSVPRTEKACRLACRTGWRMLSIAASKASPSTLRLSPGLEVRVRRGSVGSGRWLRIKQLTLSPLEMRQAVRPLSLTPLLGGEDEGAPHFKKSSIRHPLTGELDSLPERKEGKVSPYNLPHPIWSKKEVDEVRITHTPPQTKVDKAAYYCVRALRMWFDIFSGYLWGKWAGTLDEKKWLTRIIFLETVAGVPGMIAAMTRHLKSLRYMRRDHGWIHTLLEEAENERMHLLTAMVLRNPGPIFKAAVIGAQGVFVTMFWVAYLISPRFCHRFVGYLEEEAVKTYTLCLESIDSGNLPMWAQMPAPPIAVKYWQLPDGAMMRDVILAIRADEAHHRLVNHTLSNMKPHDTNPYKPGK